MATSEKVQRSSPFVEFVSQGTNLFHWGKWRQSMKHASVDIEDAVAVGVFKEQAGHFTSSSRQRGGTAQGAFESQEGGTPQVAFGSHAEVSFAWTSEDEVRVGGDRRLEV